MPLRSRLSSPRESRTPLRAPGRQTALSVSLLALTIHALLTPAQARETPLSEDLVVDAAVDDTATENQQDYAVQTTRAGTKMLLTPRDVPQSLSVVTEQRMLDQNLQTVGEVLDNATGIASQLVDSERSSYFSRGFQITNYTFDDIPTSAADNWNYGDAGEDTAIYDRIEVVRGATGLMSGAGSPSASVNMVDRKSVV